MTYRLFAVIFVVTLAIVFLVSSAISNTAKAVVTVDQLLRESGDASRIRLGARVTEDEINYQTHPEFLLRFTVRDIASPQGKIAVEYRGMKPDTLRAGRDVILEGDFKGNTFIASSLLTQCPSKYEVPVPPGTSEQGY